MKFFRIVLWYAMVVIGFVVLFEMAVRALAGGRINYQGTSGSLYQQHAWGNLPGWKPGASGVSFGMPVHINLLGVRGPMPDLRSGKKVLLLIGDSVLFGVGVPDTATVAGLLRKQVSDSTWEIVNAGVIGYTSAGYEQALQFWMQKLPVRAVWLFFVLNDVYQDSSPLEKPRRISGVGRMLAFLRTRSKAYLWLKNILFRRAQAYFRYDYSFYHAHSPQLKTALRHLQHIRLVCREANIPLTVVLLPYREQFKRLVPDPWRPQEMLRDSLLKMPLPFLDARDAFADSACINKYYLYGDPMHFSARGHRALAEFLQNRLMASLVADTGKAFNPSDERQDQSDREAAKYRNF